MLITTSRVRVISEEFSMIYSEYRSSTDINHAAVQNEKVLISTTGKNLISFALTAESLSSQILVPVN